MKKKIAWISFLVVCIAILLFVFRSLEKSASGVSSSVVPSLGVNPIAPNQTTVVQHPRTLPSRSASEENTVKPVVDKNDPDPVIETEEDCEVLCGVECIQAPNGKLACPPPCFSAEDCTSSEVCMPIVIDKKRATSRCLASTCSGLGDQDDCGEGKTCLNFGRKMNVYRCVASGFRKAGDPCVNDAQVTVNGLCEKGLICDGYCVPALCTEHEDCPTGSLCFSSGPDRSCIWTCRSTAECPEEFVCTHFSGRRQCVPKERASSCLLSECPTGASCVVASMVPWRPLAACMFDCSAAGACPNDGSVCSGSHCWPSCENTECPESMYCKVTKNRQRVCVFPDVVDTFNAFFAEMSGDP